MALTQGAWLKQTTQNANFKVWKCTLGGGTDISDAYTLKTPQGLDTKKPWTLLHSSLIAIDNGTLPLKLWGGWSASFALTGDTTTVAATDGVYIKTLVDDVVGAVAGANVAIQIDPDSQLADVTAIASVASGLKSKVPVFPYYVFHLDGATLVATSAYFWICQQQ